MIATKPRSLLSTARRSRWGRELEALEAAAGLPDHAWVNIALMVIIAAAVFAFVIVTVKDQ